MYFFRMCGVGPSVQGPAPSRHKLSPGELYLCGDEAEVAPVPARQGHLWGADRIRSVQAGHVRLLEPLPGRQAGAAEPIQTHHSLRAVLPRGAGPAAVVWTWDLQSQNAPLDGERHPPGAGEETDSGLCENHQIEI